MTVEVAPRAGLKLKTRVERRGRPVASRRFEWGVLFTGGWLVAGGYADAWAHGHVALESFFTPWHGILYSGVLAVMVFFGVAVARNWLRGYPLRRALPVGYQLSLLGVLLFPFGGTGDMTWHLIFGIEKGLDAALSPTHLLMALAIALVGSGPLRAGWRRRNSAQTFAAQLPMVVSVFLTISTMTLIMQLIHPAIKLPVSAIHVNDNDNLLTIVSVVIQTMIYMGFFLLMVRRWKLLPGSLTFIIVLNLSLLSLMRDNWLIIPVALVIGLGADALVYYLKPSAERPAAFHLFGFAMPAFTFLCYFLTLMLVGRLDWTIYLWLGTTTVAGLTGWLLSYLIVPPAIPREESLEELA
jgi:hypothetical protein